MAISEFLTAEAQADLGAFANLVGTDWPVLPVSSLVDALAATRTQLYPYPVLSWARRKVDGFADLWRSVGDGQKALYWEQLRARSGHSSSGQPFTYNTDEMGNLFQLEAVTEFFMDWVEPSTPGTSPAPAVPVPPKVDLLAPDWNLVVLDPFDHDRLGSPILPRPDYQLAPYTPSQPVAPCEPSVTFPLQADRSPGGPLPRPPGPGCGLAPLVDHLQPPLGGLPAPVGPQRVGAVQLRLVGAGEPEVPLLVAHRLRKGAGDQLRHPALRPGGALQLRQLRLVPPGATTSAPGRPWTTAPSPATAKRARRR